jgi:hypothetical protein
LCDFDVMRNIYCCQADLINFFTCVNKISKYNDYVCEKFYFLNSRLCDSCDLCIIKFVSEKAFLLASERS